METIILIIIVLTTVILSGRSIYLFLKGKKKCNCANKGCSLKNCGKK